MVLHPASMFSVDCLPTRFGRFIRPRTLDTMQWQFFVPVAIETAPPPPQRMTDGSFGNILSVQFVKLQKIRFIRGAITFKTKKCALMCQKTHSFLYLSKIGKVWR